MKLESLAGEDSPGTRTPGCESWSTDIQVSRWQAGDAAAFRALYDRFAPLLKSRVTGRRRVWPMLNGRFQVEDVVQEIWTRVIPSVRKAFTPSGPGSFCAFLGRLADSTMVDMVRTLRAAKRGEDHARPTAFHELGTGGRAEARHCGGGDPDQQSPLLRAGDPRPESVERPGAPCVASGGIARLLGGRSGGGHALHGFGRARSSPEGAGQAGLAARGRGLIRSGLSLLPNRSRVPDHRIIGRLRTRSEVGNPRVARVAGVFYLRLEPLRDGRRAPTGRDERFVAADRVRGLRSFLRAYRNSPVFRTELARFSVGKSVLYHGI